MYAMVVRDGQVAPGREVSIGAGVRGGQMSAHAGVLRRRDSFRRRPSVFQSTRRDRRSAVASPPEQSSSAAYLLTYLNMLYANTEVFESCVRGCLLS